MKLPRFAFAGDRDIAVSVLQSMLSQGDRPLALLVPDSTQASHDHELITMCRHLCEEHIVRGTGFRDASKLELLRRLELDFLLCVHFPYVIPKSVLEIPRVGALNLHPAFLPYNRGWHTPTWAILDGTPFGATLHFMDTGIDTGDIVHQKEIQVSDADTANSRYQRVKAVEVEVFTEAWPALKDGTYTRIRQSLTAGTTHKRGDLFHEELQYVDLDAFADARSFLRKLRALTTNDPRESAYFTIDGKRYRIQVAITEDPQVGR